MAKKQEKRHWGSPKRRLKRTHNVTRWRDADRVERWVASAWWRNMKLSPPSTFN
jgi:hypothetical protein